MLIVRLYLFLTFLCCLIRLHWESYAMAALGRGLGSLLSQSSAKKARKSNEQGTTLVGNDLIRRSLAAKQGVNPDEVHLDTPTLKAIEKENGIELNDTKATPKASPKKVSRSRAKAASAATKSSDEQSTSTSSSKSAVKKKTTSRSKAKSKTDSLNASSPSYSKEAESKRSQASARPTSVGLNALLSDNAAPIEESAQEHTANNVKVSAKKATRATKSKVEAAQVQESEGAKDGKLLSEKSSSRSAKKETKSELSDKSSSENIGKSESLEAGATVQESIVDEQDNKSLDDAKSRGDETQDESDLKIQLIHIDDLNNDLRWSRNKINDLKAYELSYSIKLLGFIEPLIVRPVDHSRLDRDLSFLYKYEVICGRLRVKAAKYAGIEYLPCIVRDMSDEVAYLLSLHENNKRCDLTFSDLHKDLVRITKQTDLNVLQLQLKLGINVSSLRQHIWTDSLVKELKSLVTDEDISCELVDHLCQLTEEQQHLIAQNIIKRNLSDSQIINLIEELKKRDEKANKSSHEVSKKKKGSHKKVNESEHQEDKQAQIEANIENIESRINSLLSVGKAKVKIGKDNKAKLVFDVDKLEDLDELVANLMF